jgi:hypothetical protein
LLVYLAECTSADRSAREVDIAADVLGKGSDFDSNQDSVVRVYVHNLRQKLDQYYADADPTAPRVIIPKGEYRLTLDDAPPSTPAIAAPAPRPVWITLVATIVVLNAAAWVWVASDDPLQAAAASPVWAPLLADDKPILVVVGDYYIFAELDRAGNVMRMVREFNVNSSADLDDPLVVNADDRYNYMDLDLTYLPRSTSFALADVLRVVYAADKDVQVMPSSELRIDDLRRNHVVYVGYLSALSSLMDYTFAASELRVGDTFDDLVHADSRRRFRSTAGIPGQTNYKDYGFVSRFPGPNDNHVLIVAGTRDSGLMHSAQALRRDSDLVRLGKIGGTGAVSFEAVFEVTGFDRMPLDARLVHGTQTHAEGIWGGEARLTTKP